MGVRREKLMKQAHHHEEFTYIYVSAKQPITFKAVSMYNIVFSQITVQRVRPHYYSIGLKQAVSLVLLASQTSFSDKIVSTENSAI